MTKESKPRIQTEAEMGRDFANYMFETSTQEYLDALIIQLGKRIEESLDKK